MSKKRDQLGMNPSTASNRLVKDLLWHYAKVEGCYHCGGSMTRDTFSIEHKVPWLDSEDPVGLFFDIDNIAYSHHSCNVRAGRKPNKKYFSPRERHEATLRINRENYDPSKRREQYLKHGH